MAELAVGDPARWSVDIGPDDRRRGARPARRHVDAMRAKGLAVHALPLPAECADGTFVAPTVIEIDRIADIPGEVFGPVLHVLRWRFGELDALIDDDRRDRLRPDDGRAQPHRRTHRARRGTRAASATSTSTAR